MNGSATASAKLDKPTQQGNSEGSLKHVILTGSTGSLGNYLLHELLADSTITRITCLNRSDDAVTRQTSSHESRGLTTDFSSSRIEFHTCDLAASNLGLDSEKYQSLLATVTHVIHNAWPVDFNRHFSTFEPQLRGVKNLIDFTNACLSRSIRLFFVSSVSAAGRWIAVSGETGPVPEIVLEDWKLASTGYGQSKLVAERLIAEAGVQYGTDGVICRVGQVGGPVLRGTQGEWPQAEWVPSLVQSSKTMKLIPSSLGPIDLVDWIPVDLVAQICVELLFAISTNQTDSTTGPNTKTQTSVYHVVNPHTTSWSSTVLPPLQKHLSPDVQAVSLPHWTEELEKRISQAQKNNSDLSDLPAAKLLTMFSGLKSKMTSSPDQKPISFETKETIKHSQIMSNVSVVTEEWVELWAQQWRL